MDLRWNNSKADLDVRALEGPAKESSRGACFPANGYTKTGSAIRPLLPPATMVPLVVNQTSVMSP